MILHRSDVIGFAFSDLRGNMCFLTINMMLALGLLEMSFSNSGHSLLFLVCRSFHYEWVLHFVKCFSGSIL